MSNDYEIQEGGHEVGMMTLTDEDGCFTREYLEWVIKRFGPDKEIMNTNCGGNPTRLGDYAFVHGTAKELLDRLNNGTRTRMA